MTILSSGSGTSPMALATSCPFGSLILHPRSRFRSASTLGFTATEAGNTPSGFTSDVSIL
jgi:hypothetical protein